MCLRSKTDCVPKAYQVPSTRMMLGSGKSLAMTGPSRRLGSCFRLSVLVLIGEATVRVSRMERVRKVRKVKRVRVLLVSEERRGGRNMLVVVRLVVRSSSDNEGCCLL